MKKLNKSLILAVTGLLVIACASVALATVVPTSAIVKGQDPPKPGTPASFDVLLRELQSLGLDVTLVRE